MPRTFQLTPPEPRAGAKSEASSLHVTTLGIVVNPKLKKPVLATTDGQYVGIRSLEEDNLLERIGRGYYDSSESVPSDRTRYPRSHTPDGVTIRGGGYGTCLYTALCLGSYLDAERQVTLDLWPRKHEKGICSYSEDRSAAANNWWNKAYEINLTERDEDSETEEGVTLDVDPDDIQPFYSGEGEVSYVNEVNVDISKTITIDEYDYIGGAWNRDLVLAELVVDSETLGVPMRGAPEDLLSILWRAVRDEGDLLGDVNQDALVALDVRGLSEQAVNLLAVILQHNDLEELAEELRYRWQHNLDPSMRSSQQRLFRKNADDLLARVEAARERVGWAELEDLP